MNEKIYPLKVSVITSVYNNVSTVQDAIESVLSQSYSNIEYIVIDGGSSDGTLDILKNFQDRITHFISEPDKGIYDGLNKGISMATGDVIAFLHSDDLYPDTEIILEVVKAFSNDIDGVYGDLIYTPKHNTNKILRYWKSRPFEKKLLSQGWMPAHPTLFLKKSIYEKYGTFDLAFRIAADYDFLLRILKQNIKVHYLPKVLYKMRVGGESNKNIRNIFRKSHEDLKALRKNKIGGFSVIILKNISKIGQFLNNPFSK